MKNSIILSIIFILGIHGIHAGTPEFVSKKNSGNTIEITINLNPVVPQVFMESVSPVTPAEADFNDASPEPAFTIEKYAPVEPKEATFDDESPASSPVSDPLAPTTPRYASFDD